METCTLQQVFERAQIDAADAVKMNIHGSEYEVLMDSPTAVLRRCRRIMVQYHEVPASSGITKAGLLEHMRAAGFRLLKDRPSGSSGLAEFVREESPIECGGGHLAHPN